MTSVSSGGPRRATFYTRANCSLCEVAYARLARLAAEGLVVVERVDISDDPALTAAYGSRIPVLRLEGGVTFEGRISEFRVRRALAADNKGETLQ